ncbi:MAG: hypothetical protein FWE90_11215 [Defluviitaleaceae bacterium]|nr:hypothetical protein [Defluviitaleaceae bacterium]
MQKKTTPIGYVELPNGSKAIYPMNDIFLNFTFENAAYWETLRTTVNLLIEAYRVHNPETRLKPIEGTIHVRTQFKHMVDINNTTKDQDIKLTDEDEGSTYIEFQNRGKTDIPIEIRSMKYFGLGIGQGKGRTANQMWLLAEDVDSVLQRNTFARYILKDESTGNMHPTDSGILYISLRGLSKEHTPAGELALYLLGKESEPVHKEVQAIINAFQASFHEFKESKEAVRMLSLYERAINEGRYEGIEEGIKLGEARGEARGEFKGARATAYAIARNMKTTGMDKQMISQLTGLTLDEVEEA